MSSEQFKHIQEIRGEWHRVSEVKRNKDSLNNTIQHLAEDLNSKYTHFIFELIQNAEDNTYEVSMPSLICRLTKIDLTNSGGSDGALIIQNNEIGFNRDNVNAICAASITTKKKAEGYIGEKGIGFKSVFRVTKNPHIFSNGYHFCLPEQDEQTGFRYIVPQWIDTLPKGLDLSKTHIILPLNKSEFGYNEIEEMLLDIEPETILFLSKLQEIRIKTDTGTDLTILKNDSAKPKIEILIEGKKQGCSFSTVNSFLVCAQTFHKPAHIHHEKRDQIENRDVTVAFPLDENPTAVGKIFAYLPVRSDLGFPFLVNADFILTSSREDILDVPWNRFWLMDCVADLIARESLPHLKERKLLSVDFLEALASELNKLAEDRKDMFYPVFSRLRETFMNEELLPANDGTFVSAQNAMFTRSTAVRNLLTHTQLGFLFPRSDVESDSELKWLSADITQDLAPALREYLTDCLRIEEVRPPTFASKLSLDFLIVQTDEWFVKFYEFLSGQSSLWNSEVSILRTKPILRLEDGTHVNPPKNKLASDVYLSLDPEIDSSLPIVKLEISQDEDAHKFLKELGIPEWDIVAEVIDQILPKYWNDQSSISSVEYERDFSKIVSAYDTDSENKKTQLREKLQITSFIFVKKLDASSAIYLKPNQLYFGTDGLWGDRFTGSYSPVSVSEEVCQFLKKLGIPQWDAVEEVIKTILPKYKRNPPRVSIEEHMNDFKKITQAYETGEQSGKMKLKTALQATHFILAENPSADFPIYLKPDRLYLGTDALRMYFGHNSLACWIEIWKNDDKDLTDLWEHFVYTPSEEPIIVGAFVDLDKYPDTAHALFEDLKVPCSVRVKRQEKNLQGHVTIVSEHGRHQRGLDGFDPHIQVDGLEQAINNPTPEKSTFIWNTVALPYADCIRGRVQKSTTQSYGNSSFEDILSHNFGNLLVNNAWLPDIDENMHKPSEITLAELPEEFVRVERLANQLRMKKDEVAELAEKSGVPVEAIRNLMENPEEYEEFKEWKAEKTEQEQPPSPEPEKPGPKTIPHQIDYSTEIEKSFNKTGKTEVKTQIIDDGKVNNPERRREKVAGEHRDRLNEEPSADDRRREMYRTILEGPDPQVREYLFQMYDGKCQICDHSFPERDGKPFFVASYIVERQKSGAVDTSANALCLCADHFAKFKHSAVEAEDVSTQIENFQTESEGGDCRPILDIKLCGEKCEIRFKEKHLLDLQELVKISNDD